MPSLADLGWDALRAAEFEPLAASGLVPGRVSLEHNHVYRVMAESGEALAEASGRIKHLASGRRELPAVGDWVALRAGAGDNRSTIRQILTRRTWFSRKAAGRPTDEQVLAANVDAVFLVFGLDKPVNARAIERYLAMARRSGATPVVVLNKADVVADVTAARAEASVVAGDAPVHAVSALDSSCAAVFEAYLRPGVTVALLGPSGVGKSSIVNRLVGADTLRTGDVRDWDRRGRHTSVHRQMVVRPAGGLIVDTPGLRELQLWDTDEEVSETFSEITDLAAECRFRDCQHESEPGCAVKASVEAGTLDAGRYEGFLKLRREQLAVEKLRDERALLEDKRQSKIIQKSLKAMQKSRDR